MVTGHIGSPVVLGPDCEFFSVRTSNGASGSGIGHLVCSDFGTLTRVTLEPAWDKMMNLDLHDDGISPDKVAGDRIFSINVPLASLIRTPDDVFRPFLGFLKLWTGTTVVASYNIFLPVAAPDIPRMPIVDDSSTMRHTTYVVNILAPEVFPASSSATLGNFTTVTQKFYQRFGDDYDVLNMVWASPSFFQNRDHSIVKNTTQGIGVAQVDNSATFSSKGTLIGITRFPSTAFLDGAETGNQHELGHQWINHFSFAPLAASNPHWPISTMASGTMGFSIPPTNEGGEFHCLLTKETGGIRLTQNNSAPVFADLDLYLMGLLPPVQVGENIVIGDPTQAAFVMTHCDGRLYTGPFTTLTALDVINVGGARIPDSNSSKKQFRVATILMTRDKLLDDDAMAFFSYFVRRAEEKGEVPSHIGFTKVSAKPFAISTRGLASWNLQLTPTALPEINYGGVVNGASGGSVISPGSYASIYGTMLAPAAASAALTPLSTTLGSATVLVNGVPAPAYYVSPLQVNFQVPFATPPGLATVSISWNRQPSSIAWVQVKLAAPGILTYGSNHAVAQNPDSSLNAADAPIAPGSYLTVYLTGIGPLDNTPADGAGAPLSPLANATLSHSAFIGGLPATISFLGLAPGFVGLGQANILVPNASPGERPLSITIGGVASNSAIVSIAAH